MTKNIVIGVLAVTTLLFGFLYFTQTTIPYGSATGTQHYQEEAFLQGFQVGPRGSDIKNVLKGTCALIPSAYSVVASTSISVDCAVTGVQSGDTVFGSFGSAAAAAGGPGWEITGVSASTTNGYITFNITNGTGATALIPGALASSTRYIDIR